MSDFSSAMLPFPFALYEIETGRLVTKGRAWTEKDQLDQGETFPHLGVIPEEVESLDQHYVVAGELRPRPDLLIMLSDKEFIADGITEVRLRGFPDPCTLVVNGETVDLAGGEITFTADTPAIYRIECSHWPYRDWAYEIEAKDPRA